jgi:phospholipid/cholesterol/gamma-HCH transport system ATP-binding protein
MGTESTPWAAALRLAERVGRATARGVSALGFAAQILVQAAGWLLLGRFRGKPVRSGPVFAQMMEVGIAALPIMTLLSFTIGVMLAIQGIDALRPFGAEDQVVIGVALSITREFAPLIGGILMAGRSGSSLAARLGTMTIRQELDALDVMGIEPVRFMVVPALVAMILMLPALTLWSDLVGLLGAGLYVTGELGMTFGGGQRGLGARGCRRRRPGHDGRSGPRHRRDHRHRHGLRLPGDARMSAAQPSPAREAVIEVRDLESAYGERRILKGVSLDVLAGEILVIMGGSGSGKSTLLRHLVGLEHPLSGSVRVLGCELGACSAAERTALRQKIGVAFQGGALLSSLSVGENMRLPLHEHTDLDLRTMEIMTRLKLEVVHLAGFEDLMPAELSGGMIKRAALARAIVMDPRLLMTIVVVTHELDSAFHIADRITVLDAGELLITGSVEEVRSCDHPRVQDLLQRRFEIPDPDPEEYLARLTGRAS